MRTRITTVAIVALVLSTAGSALAAVNPTVSTGGHSALTPTSVTLLGKVNPHGVQTSYHFEYGTTKGYGTQTGPTAAGNGTATSNASAAIVGLTPNTTYHYRIVAVTAAGSILGGDQALKTPKQPLGLSLLANPNPVPFGASTTVAATLTGTDRANRNIVLQQRPFPYTAPFAQVGNVVVTNSLGVAPFVILAQQMNTQYRALVQGTSVVAPIVTVGVAVGVHLNLRSHHVHSGSMATFSGSVSPAEDGALYAIQRFEGTWKNVAGGSLHHSSAGSSKFSIQVKMRHSGIFRVFVGVADGSHTSASSASVHLIVIPRKPVHHH